MPRARADQSSSRREKSKEPLPQPRSRKVVLSWVRTGDSGSAGSISPSRNSRIFASASESSNQTVPMSEGSAEWFDISFV